MAVRHGADNRWKGLEVDHIQDIVKGGPDSPVQMIALCSNCHTIKTHGRSRGQLRRKLLDLAKRLHQELVSGT